MAKARKIKNLMIDEVSLVDSPANRRAFMFWKNADGANSQAADVTKATRFKSLEVSFKSDGTAGGTSLTINGTNVADPRSFILSANRFDEDNVSLFAEYTVAARGVTNGGFSSTRTYTLRKADDGFAETETDMKKRAVADDMKSIRDYLPDLPPGLRTSVENILGAVESDGPGLTKEIVMPETKDDKQTPVTPAPIDVDAIVTAVATTLKESLTKDVADAVLLQIRADQAAVTEQAAKDVEAKAAKDAAEQTRVDSGELVEFEDEAAMETQLSQEATEAALTGETGETDETSE